jgi:hypothetical protein
VVQIQNWAQLVPVVEALMLAGNENRMKCSLLHITSAAGKLLITCFGATGVRILTDFKSFFISDHVT